MTASQQPEQEPRTPWSNLAGMGFEFGASLAVFMLLGWWVDRHWQIQGNWGLLIGTLLGLIGGSYNFIRESMKAIRESDRQTRKWRQGHAPGDPPDDVPKEKE